MPSHDIAFYLTEGGQNSAAQPARLAPTQYARATNIAIVNELPTTRPRVRVVPLSGDAAELLATGNVQGAIFYNPAEGQGAVSYGRDESMILVSSAGRKLAIRFEGRGSETTGTVEDVSFGIVGDANLHLAYFSQWERYALCGDGNGNTWIWDGANDAFASPGYNIETKDESRVPNGATVMLYAHGRGLAVANSRAVLASDRLNSLHLKTPEDVLSFTEQVYFATGQYFSPPSAMGAINAGAILPRRNTQHGHGEVMMHCENGIFSIDLNVSPRTRWSETPMVQTAYLGGGATGPYAVAIWDGDQIFRSHVGVQTLRSAAAESSLVGNPQQPVSEPIMDFFDGDSSRYLRFASVATWQDTRRALVTCYPIVQGRFRWHRGAVSFNFDPVPNRQTPPAWDSMWTLPPQVKGIVQFVAGRWDGENRLFALCRGGDGRTRLVEFRDDLQDDELENGVKVRVRSQLISRKLDMQQPFIAKEFQRGSLFLSGVVGRVDFGVWYRQSDERAWTFWNGGFVDNTPEKTDSFPPFKQDSWEGEIPLGEIGNCGKKVSSRNVQFLIRLAGVASVETLRIGQAEDTARQDTFDAKRLRVKVTMSPRSEITGYDDYEYSDQTEADSWLKALTTK